MKSFFDTKKNDVTALPAIMLPFGQKAPLTTTLRNVLRDYGAPQLLNEQLQNADDAGARVFRVVLSGHRFGSKSCVSNEVGKWQGAALYVYDDAVFRDEDFSSIQRVGDGVKRGDPTKTGQFGLGFNSVYHVTDLPSFVSGTKLAIFDPHQTHGLTHQSGSAAGALFELDALKEAANDDQLAPFEHYGDLFGGFREHKWPSQPGTIFRLPLRDAAAAKLSEIARSSFGLEDALREVVAPFAQEAHRRLLFLRSVERLEVYVDHGGRAPLKVLAKCEARGCRSKRRELLDFLRREMALTKVEVLEDEPEASTRYHAAVKRCHASVPRPTFSLKLVCEECEENWVICSVFGDKEDVEFAASKRARSKGLCALMPYAACAARVDNDVQGRLYQTLPTPMTTSLKVHLDARFELTRDRNALALDTAGPMKNKRDGADAVRAEWNVRVMLLAAKAHALAVETVARDFGAEASLRLLPIPASSAFAPLHEALYNELLDRECLRCGPRMLRPSQVYFDEGDAPAIAQLLAERGEAVVKSPRGPEFEQAADAHVIRRLTPAGVKRHLDHSVIARLGGDKEWCRAILSYASSEQPEGLGGLAVVLQDGSLARVDDKKILVDLVQGRQGELKKGPGAALIDASKRGRLLVEDDDDDDDDDDDESCARLLWRLWPSRRAFGAQEAAALGLPAAWRGMPRVDASREQLGWLNAFWTHFGDDVDTLMRDLGDWPLVPSAGAEVLRLDLSHRVLRSTTNNNDTLFAALAALGLSVAADEAALPPTLNLATLGAAAVADAIAAIQGRQDVVFAALGDEARDALLELCASDAAALTSEQLDSDVASAPLFRYLDGTYACMAPERELRYTGTKSSSMKLLAAPTGASCMLLYERLGARPLPKSAYWHGLTSDAAAWARRPEADRLALLGDLLRDYESIRDEPLPKMSRTFGSFFAEDARVFWSDVDGAPFLCARELADPREELHADFAFQSLPSASLRGTQLLPFMERAGMPRGLTRAQLTQYARAVDASARRQIDDDTLRKAAKVVRALFTRYSELDKEQEKREWLRELGGLLLAQPAYAPPTAAFEALRRTKGLADRVARLPDCCSTLVPLRGSLVAGSSSSALREHATCWSRLVAVRLHGAYAPAECLELLGALKEAPLEACVAHLDNVASLPQSALVDWDAEHRLQRRSTGSSHGSGLAEQLRVLWDALSMHAIRAPGETRRQLSALQRGVVPLRDDITRFVSLSALFGDLKSKDAPPYAYRLDRAHDSFLSMTVGLTEAIGVARTPTAAQIRKWARHLGDRQLDEAQLETACALARLYAEVDGVEEAGLSEEACFLAPEAASWQLRRADELVFDDAPWLDERVDKSKCGLIVPALHDIALQLGARPLSRVIAESAASVVAMGEAAVEPSVQAALALWSRNLRSAAFRCSVRRALSDSSVKAKRGGQQQEEVAAGPDEGARRLNRLRHLEIKPARHIESRYSLKRRDGSTVDVTRSAKGSQALLDDAASTVFVLYETTAGSIRPGWRRRWLPAIAIALDRFLSAGALRERGILSELLTVDDAREMSEVLDIWEVPSLALELGLGEPYDEAAEGAARPIIDVLKPGDEVLCYYEEALVCGRVAAILADQSVLCVVAPDGETAALDVSKLRRRPTVDERVAEALARREALAKEQGEPSQRSREALLEPDARVRDEERGVVFRGADGWHESEVAARKELADRTRRRLEEEPAEPEPRGIDGLLVRQARAEDVGGVSVAFSEAQLGVVRRERVTAGYNIVRVANLREDDHGAPDIAFFHSVPTLDEIFEDSKRLTLARQCCGALREVTSCFGLDAALVTLFYEPGAASRFVRQKLLFNIHPVEQRRDALKTDDVRTDAFVYAYFYGLCIHKLAHFFDVVHGTRHEFFMSEYRAHFALKWIELLCRLGFDPGTVAHDFPELLWEVVT